MRDLEKWLQKNPKVTLQGYADHNFAFVIRLYDNTRGNYLGGGHGTTIVEAMQEAYKDVTKGESCKSSEQIK